jgi:hypothetical protein
LLRAAVAAELYGVTILLFAALALYQLFKKVDSKVSTLMAGMMLVSVPISYINVLNNIAPLVLLKNSAIAAVLDPGQMAAQVTLFLRLHDYGLVVNQIFWACGCFRWASSSCGRASCHGGWRSPSSSPAPAT